MVPTPRGQSASASAGVVNALSEAEESDGDETSDADDSQRKQPFRKRSLFGQEELKELAKQNVSYWASKQTLVATYKERSEDGAKGTRTHRVKLTLDSRKKSSSSDTALKHLKQKKVEEALFFAAHGTVMPESGGGDGQSENVETNEDETAS